MRKNRINKSIFLISLLAGVLFCQGALAQSPEVQAAREQAVKQTQKSLPAVTAVEGLEDRRSALISIFDLTLAEIDDVVGPEKLGVIIKRSDASLATFAKTLQRQLVLYREYIKIIRARVDQSGVTDEEIRGIAGEHKEWREEVYAPTVRQAFGVVLVSQGNEVLLTGQRRLERVASDVSKLQAGLGSSASKLIPLLDSAKKDISIATNYHLQARETTQQDQKNFETKTYETAVGVPEQVVLRRGLDGDFFCINGVPFFGGRCALTFRRSNGRIYSIVNEDGSPAMYAVGDVYQVGGVLIDSSITGEMGSPSGVILMNSINLADKKEVSRSAMKAPLATALEIITAPETVQSLIEKEVEAIQRAYKTFFVMSTTAKKLMAR